MKVLYTINNYTVGAKLRTAPTHLITRQERIDSKYTEVEFDFPDDPAGDRLKQFTDKVLAKKGRAV